MRLPLTAAALALATPAAAQPLVLPELIVSANRTPTPAETTGSTVSVLTEEDLQADGRPFVLDHLRDLPGVSVHQNGPAGTLSGLTVRGLPQQYVRVLVDGIEISDPTGPQVSASLSNLLIDDIALIEVLKGSQSALYGGQAVGGVIDIRSPVPEVRGLESRYLLEGGSFDTLRGRYTLAGRLERASFALTAARLQSNGFSAADEADGNREDDGYETTRLSGSGTFHATDRVSFFGSAFWQEEDGDFDAIDFATSRPIDAGNTFEAESWGLRAGSDFTLFDSFENTVALSWFRIDRTQISEFGPFVTKGIRTRAEYLGAFPVSPSLGLQFGADLTRETSDTNFAPKEANRIGGVFVQADWSPTSALTLNAAARHDIHSEFGGFTTGRLTAAYAVADAMTLRGSLGTGFRPPSNFELFDQSNFPDPGVGNPDLEPETSVSADLGVERRFAGRGRASATLFWLRVEDLIEFDFATNSFFQADGSSESRGLEVEGTWELTERLALSGTYTYTDARNPEGDRRDRVPRHALGLALDGTPTDRISLGLGARYVADYLDTTGPADTTAFDEDYLVVNARLGYAVTDMTELYLRAENLLDAEYQTARGYGTADRSVYFGVTGRF